MELPLAPLLFRWNGGLEGGSWPHWLTYRLPWSGVKKKLTGKNHELAGREFNIGSPKQVGEVLSELDMASGRRLRRARVSTSTSRMEELAQTHELPRL